MSLHLISQLDFGYSSTKPWVETEKGFFSGSIFIDNHLLSSQEFSQKLSQIRNCDEAVEFVKKLNGHFAIALEFDGTIFLAVDHERTIPIFYEINETDVLIYNHITIDLIRQHGINRRSLDELDYCLFVSGNDNLALGVKSVMAGEAVVIDNNDVSRKYYHEFNYPKIEYPDKNGLFHLIDEKFIEVTKRLITYLNGRCAVVPLSGGHDSRIIVYYLKYLGYDNILAYTYGPKGNAEALTSQKVAEYLGIDWHFVEYDPKKLQKLFEEKFYDLVNYCSNGVSSVCIQDWYAIEYLHNNRILPKNAVVVPGHAFDAIAGSFILPLFIQNDSVTKEQLINKIFVKHFSEGKRTLPSNIHAYLVDKISNELLCNKPNVLVSNRAFDLYQDFNVRERQAKYICNSVRLYEYYGYDWYLPLWDNELVSFWETIELKNKYNRRLFFEFTKYKYGDLMKAAPVENGKSKDKKDVNMNPIVRLVRKAWQLFNYVDFHYCLAYFTRLDVLWVYFQKKVLNIGYMVNQKIKRVMR